MRRVFIVGIIVLLSSCTGFEKIALFKGDRRPLLGTPALEYQSGNYTNENWKGESSGIKVEDNDEGFNVSRIDADKRLTLFGTTFNDGIDFRGNIAVVVVARALEGEAPMLKLALIDNKGYVANGRDLSERIAVGNDFKSYIFRLDGAFTQITPEVKDVNAGFIKRMEFAINQGKKGYKGKIEIAEVKVQLGTEVDNQKTNGPKGEAGGVIVDFEKDNIKDWYTRGSGIKLSKEKKAMVMDCDKVGPLYQAAGSKIKTISLKDNPIIKVRAKVESDEIPTMRVDLKDINGKVTNKYPAHAQLDGIDRTEQVSNRDNPENITDPNLIRLDVVDISASGEKYVDYYFDFSKRLKQSYPKPVELDEERIVELKLYINPGFIHFNGKVYIQSIEATK